MDLESQTITPAVAVLDPKEDLEVVVVEEDLEEAAGGLEISLTVTTTMEVEGDLEEGPQVEDLEEGPRVEDLEPKRRVDLGAGDLDQRTMANLLDLEEDLAVETDLQGEADLEGEEDQDAEIVEKRDTLPESVQNPAKVVEVVVTGDAEIVGKKDILLESVPIPRKKEVEEEAGSVSNVRRKDTWPGTVLMLPHRILTDLHLMCLLLHLRTKLKSSKLFKRG